MEDHIRVDICSAAHGRPYTRASGYALKEAAAHEEPILQQATGRNVGLWRGTYAGADFSAGTMACGERTLEQSISEGLFIGELQYMEGSTLEQSVKDCILWEGPQTGAEWKSEEEEDEVAETKCYELTATCIPHSSALLRAGRAYKS